MGSGSERTLSKLTAGITVAGPEYLVSIDSFICGRHKLKWSDAKCRIFNIRAQGQSLLFLCLGLRTEVFILLRDDDVACSGHSRCQRGVLLRVDISMHSDL